MSLNTQLVTDMKQAMKAGDKLRLGAIRYLRSQIKNYEIDHGQQDDAGVEQIVAKQVKQIKESLAEYKQAGRDDLVQEEQVKLEVMESYLPVQLSTDEVQAIIDEVIQSQENPQLGPVIGQVMGRLKGQADGAKVAQLVRKTLA